MLYARMLRTSCVVVVLTLALGAGRAQADGEIGFFVGALTGGDLNLLADQNFDLQASFKNGTAFGARVGAYGWPFAFEGSLTYSPSNITVNIADEVPEVAGDVLLTEANLLVLILPGPVQPFVTGGIGMHFFNFAFADLARLDKAKFGYNFGGGIKFNVSRISIRADVRDHITSFGLDDFGLGGIGEILGVTESSRVHNVELSFGVGIRF